MAAASSSPIQSSPSSSTSPSTSSSPSSFSPPPHSPSPSLSPPNPNSLTMTPDPNPNMAPTVALPPPAAIALPPHPHPPPRPQQQPPPPLPPPSAPTSTRRVPPPCWSVEETVALIDGYQEKWYSLRRGNLKANHWQDVADFVTTRCANLPGSSHKTAVQCRHKVEKLRKRYRSERQRCLRNQNRISNSRTNPSSTWYFFQKMDAMELGPITNAPNRNHSSNNGNVLSSAGGGVGGNRDISGGYSNAVPTAVPSRHVPSTSPSEASSEDSDDDSDGGVGIGNNNNNMIVRNLHGLVSNGSGMKFKIPKAVRSRGGMPMLRSDGGRSMPGMYPRSSSAYPSSSSNHVSVGPGGVGGSRFKRGVYNNSGMRPGGVSGTEEMRSRIEKKRSRDSSREEVGGGGGGMEEIVSAVRMLGDGFMRMEQMKMDMEKDIHNMRMEMELKHTEMILDTQRQIVDTFLNGFLEEKKKKSKKALIGPDS